MTAVPGGPGTATLICDQCGTEDRTGEVGHDSDLVWPLVSSRGWTGSPFATGAHRCPNCSLETPVRHSTSARESRPHSASYDIRTNNDLGAAVITPLSDLDADLTEWLRDDLMRAAAHHRHVVVDLHAVRLMDSAGLGLLVRARQEARQHGATFDLAAPSRFVLTVLHTMRLDGVFRTFPDLQAARQAIRRQTVGTAAHRAG